MSTSLVDTVRYELQSSVFTHDCPEQDSARLSMLEYVSKFGADAIHRSPRAVHLTASTFVLNEDGSKILLSLHAKGKFWVQFGGHIEAQDKSLSEAALRELREESGLADVELAMQAPVEFDAHELSNNFGACRRHLDVGYLAIVSDSLPFGASSESESVEWWPTSGLPATSANGLDQRLSRVLEVSARIREQM